MGRARHVGQGGATAPAKAWAHCSLQGSSGHPLEARRAAGPGSWPSSYKALVGIHPELAGMISSWGGARHQHLSRGTSAGHASCRSSPRAEELTDSHTH